MGLLNWNDRKTARVIVSNETHQTLYQFSLIHKFSGALQEDKTDNGFETHTFPEIPPNTKTEALPIVFFTGVETTLQRDWWFAHWWDQEFTNAHGMNPNNYRYVFDWFKKYQWERETAEGAITYIASKLYPPAAAFLGSVFSFAEFVGYIMADQGNTNGFKQHVLRDGDADHDIIIHIKQDGTVEIKSETDYSDSVWSSIEVEAAEAAAMQKLKIEIEVAAWRKNIHDNAENGAGEDGNVDEEQPSHSGQDHGGKKLVRIVPRHHAQNQHDQDGEDMLWQVDYSTLALPASMLEQQQSSTSWSYQESYSYSETHVEWSSG